MKKFKLISFIAVLTVLVSFVSFLHFTHKTQAQNVNAVSGTANITNSVGYKIYFSSTDNGSPLGGTSGNIPYSVQYNPSTLMMTGFAWSPEYGWIQFNGTNTATALSFVGVNDTENPTDWAKGLIKLSGSDGGTSGNIVYKVFFDPLTGNADATNHWAWGGNVIGWVDFSNVTVALVGASNCTLTASPSSINTGDSSLLTWYGSNLVSCVASGAWSGNQSTSGGPLNTGALTTSTTYNLSCLGINGANVQCSATITLDNLCHDTNATNYLGSLPCQYNSICNDPSAINYGSVGACVYSTPGVCILPALNAGSPPPCQYAAHCTNGIKDMDETGVDCGGIDCISCSKIPHYIEN